MVCGVHLLQFWGLIYIKGQGIWRRFLETIREMERVHKWVILRL